LGVLDLAGRQAHRFAKGMKEVQSALGGHQDAVIAQATAREIGVQAHLAGENAFSFGLLQERAPAGAGLPAAGAPGLAAGSAQVPRIPAQAVRYGAGRTPRARRRPGRE
ncbi:MAG TPA: hypothetical protein VGD91_29760, partial [Trebonia sp.]